MKRAAASSRSYSQPVHGCVAVAAAPARAEYDETEGEQRQGEQNPQVLFHVGDRDRSEAERGADHGQPPVGVHAGGEGAESEGGHLIAFSNPRGLVDELLPYL